MAIVAVVALFATTASAQESSSARYTQSGKGLLSAPAYTSGRLQAGAIDVADLLVGPHQATSSNRINVGAFIEVQAGAAFISVNGKRRAIASGTIVVLKPGDTFSIDNRREPRPVVARLVRVGDIAGGSR